jgi:hypothetical protein
VQAKLGPVGIVQFGARGHTKISVQVPHGDAERHAGVQLFFRSALGHGVHCADQFVPRGRLLVQQRRWPRRVKRERFHESVAIAGEVIFGLRNIRHEDPEAVVERDVIVLVFLDADPKLRHDFSRTPHVFGLSFAHRGHKHVLTMSVLMTGGHVVDGSPLVGLLVGHIHSRHRRVVRILWRRGRLRCGRGILRNGDL